MINMSYTLTSSRSEIQSEIQALRKAAGLSLIERSALDEARRSEKLLASDPARQIQKMIESDPARQIQRMVESDPARQFERQIVKDFQLTEKALWPKPTIDTTPLTGHMVPIWDFTPRRDFQLEALADIRRSVSTTAQQQAENVHAAVLDHIRQQQDSLEGDQQLLVYCDNGREYIEVREIVLPNHHMLIFNGVDGEGNFASLIVTLNNVKIASKVIRVSPPAAPYRIGFITGTDK